MTEQSKPLPLEPICPSKLTFNKPIGQRRVDSMTDRERIALEAIEGEIDFYGRGLNHHPSLVAMKVLEKMKALGYTHQPEQGLALISRERAEKAVPSSDCSGRVYEDWEREDIIRYVLEGAEIQRDKDAEARKPEPPADKVEVVAEKLKAVWLAGNCIKRFCPDEVPMESLKDIARELLKIFPEYEPVELEALGDAEIAQTTGHTERYLDYAKDFMGKLGAISQATIQKNQAKGQLYRVKEG